MSKEEILELFDEIAARLSGPAEQVFEIAVRHRIVIGLTMLSIVALLWIAVLVGWRIVKARRVHECRKEDGYSSYCRGCSSGEAWLTAWSIMAVISLIATVSMAVPITENLITPEWTALRALVPGL